MRDILSTVVTIWSCIGAPRLPDRLQEKVLFAGKAPSWCVDLQVRWDLAWMPLPF